MPRGLATKAGILAVAILVSAGAAQATAYCEVRQTSDGFVALRAGPGAAEKLITRLKAGEQVQLDSTKMPKKNWVFVHYWQDGAIRHSGWVNRLLIEKECG